MSSSNIKNKECKEYNTLKYKTMIMTGQNIDKPIQNETNINDLDSFLMNEMNENKKQPWNKLSKTDKINKIIHFIKNILVNKYNLTEVEKANTQRYLLTLIDRKKISKNSELDYDETTGEIVNIHSIIFNTTNRNFTLNKEFKTNSKKVNKSRTVKKIKSNESNVVVHESS
tara:strand:- start:179 stop:691 length:513 start_codon:yes stop_codon:yes gene_type:complete